MVSESGDDLTPPSLKAQGLLALLAVAPDFERGRAWLQDKLWSDRAPTESSGSLRQELTRLRKRLKAYGPVLLSDRHGISLNPELIEVLEPDPDQPAEFLEGLDIRDPEFNDWLQAERHVTSSLLPAQHHRPNARMRPALLIQANSELGNAAHQIEKLVADRAAKMITDRGDVTVYNSIPGSADAALLAISIQCLGQDTRGIRLCLEAVADRRLVWSGLVCPFDGIAELANSPALDSCINQLIDAAFKDWEATLPSDCDGDATLLSYRALRMIFSIDRAKLEEAQALLDRAIDTHASGIFQAWRAQLLTIKYVECYGDDPLELVEAGREAATRAIELEPMNSEVLAAVANATTILERNHVGGGELAKLGIRANPANPLAWWALSNSQQYAGDFQGAYQAAVRSQTLGADTPLRFWGDFQRALTAALTGRVDEAIRLAETASLLAPNFRPPLRYLLALYTISKNDESAQRAVGKLLRLEEDFSIDQILGNPTYPVSIMRKGGLVLPDRLKALRDNGGAP